MLLASSDLRAVRFALGLLLALCLAGSISAQQSEVDRLGALLAESEPSEVERLEALCRRAEAALAVDYELAGRLATEAEQAARLAGRNDYVAWALACDGHARSGVDGAAVARKRLEASLAALAVDAPSKVRCATRLVQARLHRILNEPGQAALRLREALELAEQGTDERLLALSLVDLEQALRLANMPYRPDRDLDRVEAILARVAAPHVEFRVRAARLFTVYVSGREDEATRLLMELQRDCRAIGDRAAEFDTYDQLYAFTTRRADWARALEVAEEQLAVARALHDQHREAWSLDQVAWCRIRLNRPDEAVEPLAAAIRIAEVLRYRRILWAVHDSRRELATIRRDRDALLEAAVRMKQIERDPGLNFDPSEAETARQVLGSLRNETIRERERADTEQALFAEQQAAHERQLWWFGVGALVLVTALAIVAFVGMRRAQKSASELTVQTDRAQRLQQHVHQLERLDSLGMLAGGVAHDFNNLLCSIRGHVDLLDASSTNPASRSVTAIRLATERGSALCDRLLDYAKPRAEARAVVDLIVVLRDLEGILGLRGDGTAAFEVEAPTGPIPCLIDRAAIEQVVVNLVLNGLDPQVGASLVRLRVELVGDAKAGRVGGEWIGTPEPADGYVAIEVRDDGRGIAPDRVRRLFDPFYTTKFEGRGLGLAAAFGIVKSHAGAFHVATRPGAGSAFTVVLPVREEEAVPAASPELPVADSVSSSASLRVLVVDDEPDVLEFVGEALRGAGHTVALARTKSEVLRCLATSESAPDVAVLDLSIPGVEGDELIRAVGPVCSEIVVMSGHGEDHVSDRIAGHRIRATLHKPFPMSELLASVSDARPGIGSRGEAAG